MGRYGSEFAPGKIPRWLNQGGYYGSSPPDGLLSPNLPGGTRIYNYANAFPSLPGTFLPIVAFAMTVAMIAVLMLPVIIALV